MNYYDYPLDTKYLLRKKIAIKKELLNNGIPKIEKKMAVLGGSTTNEVVSQLEIALLNYGIKGEFYQSEYGQYFQDAMFGTPELDEMKPDIIYIHTNFRNITEFPNTSMSKEDTDALFEAEIGKYTAMWEAASKRYGCPIIQNNFERPNYRIMGNRDIWDYRGRSNFIFRLNEAFYEYAATHENFYINDIDYLSADFGLDKWCDATYYHMYKYACTLEAIPHVAFSVANIIKSIYGKNKKALVLDLDNTLWGGIVGDDGVEGIAIGPEVPNGQIYSEFQKYVKDLKQTGVILAVDSKNDYDNAIAGLNHPDGILKPDDFVDIKANWEPKSNNLSEIAAELTLGVDSFVFADDNPAERDIINSQIGTCAVPNMDGAENYVKAIDHGGYFETTVLSKEDLKKTEQYHAKAMANREMASFADYNDYLKNLNMEAKIRSFEDIYVQRIAQLTNKSNQFNLTTLRCSESDIKAMQEDPSYVCVCGRLSDKFADNGLVSVMAAKTEDDTMHIKLFLMSCRVLKRGMEECMMNSLVQKAKEIGIKKIYGYYYKTAKNNMVSRLYESMGFSLEKTEGEDTVWVLKPDKYDEKPVFMNIDIQL